MNRKPKILLTNDDGIRAPGIRYLAKALEEVADLTIMAPVDEKSASGLSITIKHPLSVQEVDWDDQKRVWCVTGTPADCVKLALSRYMSDPPDLVVSGINPGSNAGRNLLYSGTVGGAIEGIMHNIPGIAFSVEDYIKPKFDHTLTYIQKIVSHVIENPLPVGTLLNVNFPNSNGGDIQGIKFTRQGAGMWIENPDQRIHPTEGHSYYWIGQKEIKESEPEDTDTWWIQKGYITAVPVHVAELTDHRMLKERKNSFEKLF